MTAVQPQHMKALEKANRFKSRQDRLCREIKAMPLEEANEALGQLLDKPIPDELKGLKIERLLKAVPQHGKQSVGTLLSRLGILSSKTLGMLTERQRKVLARSLRDKWRVDRDDVHGFIL